MRLQRKSGNKNIRTSKKIFLIKFLYNYILFRFQKEYNLHNRILIEIYFSQMKKKITT